MKAKTILIVEDEDALRKMITFNLERSGFQVRKARDTTSAKAILNESIPDLILLDWMLPGQSGLELLREIRSDEVFGELPVILLTARAEEDEKVTALEDGADDYITKPFSKRELVARINALLRRNVKDNDGVITVGELSLNLVSQQITIKDQDVHLAPTEYRLFEHFLKNQDRVYSRAQLLSRIWRSNLEVDERTVDVHIRRLRKALSPTGYDGFIQTVRGSGYRFSYPNS